MIEAQLVTPDLSDLHRFTLDNGLEVAVLPYGDAPLVRVGLQVKGDTRTGQPYGINRMAEYAFSIGDKSQENLLAVAGFMSGSDTSISTAGSSGNLDALLNKSLDGGQATLIGSTHHIERTSRLMGQGCEVQPKSADTWSPLHL